MIHKNYKRYFGPCELNHGFQLFDNFGLEDDKRKTRISQKKEFMNSVDADESNTFIKRDPYKIKKLFENLNF